MMSAVPPIGEDDLQAYVDGRLAGDRLVAVEVYLDACPDTAARVDLERRQREALRTQLAAKFTEPVPSRLRIATIRAQRRTSWRGQVLRAAAAIALLLTGGVAGHLLSGSRAAPPTMSVESEAMSAYRTFVVEVVHPVEVGAGNEQHLVRWLSKRLGRPLTAPDLTHFGYRLMGGRLLPALDGVAAQLMYEDESGKRLTVYICSGDDGQTAFQFARDGNVATFSWLDQGFGFAVSASIDRDRLLKVAQSVYLNLDDSGEGAVPAATKGG
jgi:anti-sigma factor RsiW